MAVAAGEVEVVVGVVAFDVGVVTIKAVFKVVRYRTVDVALVNVVWATFVVPYVFQ